MTTEQLGLRMVFADALRAKTGPLADLGAGPRPLPDGRVLLVMSRNERFRLDRIPELAVPELRGAIVELDRDGIALAAPCFQTLTTERDGKAICDVYRAFERCVVPQAMVANVQFSGPRGNARYACGVQPIDELVVGTTTLVGVGGAQLTFSRLDAPDPFATLVVAPTASDDRADSMDAGG